MAKRVNQRFVALLVSIGLLVTLGAVTAVLALQPPDPDKMSQQAERLQEQGKYAEAIACQHIAATVSRKAKEFLRLGLMLLERRDKDALLTYSARARLFRDARMAFKEALREDPNSLEAQQQLVELEYGIARARGVWTDYEQEVTKLLELAPDDTEALFQRARARTRIAATRREYYEAALADYQEAVTRAPNVEKYWLGMANFHAARGQQYWPKAEKVYQDALEAIPEAVDVRVTYANFIEVTDKARIDEAKKLLTDAVAKQPNNVEGYLALAGYHRRRKKLDEAIAVLEKAVKVAPADYRGYESLAYLESFRTGPKRSEAILLRGLEEVRKPARQAEGGLEGLALLRYRAGIMSLNQQLCDVLLDQIQSDGSKEQLLPRVKQALAEMKGIAAENVYVDKIAGRLALLAGDLAKAERLLRRAYTGLRPFDPKTAGLLIYVYQQLHQLGETQKIIERYLQFSKDNPALLLRLARLYVDYRQYDRAQSILKDVLKQEPHNEQGISLEAALECLTGKREGIPPAVRTLDSYTADLFLRRAQQLWLDGDPEAAIMLASDLLAREPKAVRAIVQLIKWYEQRKDTAKARALLQQALATFKDKPDVQQQLAMLLETDRSKLLAYQLELAEKISDPVRQALSKAVIYLSFGRGKEYIQQLKLAEAEDPDNRAVIERMFAYALSRSDFDTAAKYADRAAKHDLDNAGGKYYAAQIAVARKDYSKAIELAGEALAARPTFSEAHALLGDCHYFAESFEQARDEYEAAYELNPSNVKALLGLVAVAEKISTTSEYQRWVELAYRFVPTNAGIRERYLQLQDAREDPQKVIRIREQTRQSRPNNLANLYHLAALYEQAKQLNKAERQYQEIYKISRGDARSLWALTDFLRRTDRDVQAQGMLAEYARTSANKTQAYLLWGGYLENAGRIDQATTVYEKALKADKEGRAYLRVAQFAERQRKYAQAADYQEEYLRRVGKKASAVSEQKLILYRIQAGQFEQAQQRIDRLLKEDAGNPDALALQGASYFHQDEFAKAREALDKALRVKPNHLLALVYSAEQHWSTGQKSRAVGDLERIRGLRMRTSPQIAMRLAKLYDSMGNFGDADGVLASVLAENANYPPALRQRVRLCLRHKRWSQMDQAIAEGRKAYPNDAFFPDMAAEKWLQQGQPARAIAPLREAVKLARPERQPIFAVRLSDVLVEAGQYDEAIRTCRSLRGHPLAAPAMAVSGRAHANANKQPEAEADFTAALKAAQPQQLPFIIRQVTKAYALDQAVANLKRWTSLRPEDWELPFAVGDLMVQQENFQGATKQFEKALGQAQTDSQKAQTHQRLGLTHSNLGQYQKSRQAYEQSLKLQPEDAATLNNLAWAIAVHLNKPDEALPYARKAVELLPDNPNVLDTYGVVLLRKGDLVQATEVLNRSVSAERLPGNLLHLGNVYEKLNRKEEALRQYRAAWELVKDDPKNPQYQELREAIARLGGGL